MKRRMLAITLLVVALLCCFVSCGKKSSHNSKANQTADYDKPQFTESQINQLIYNDFYYYADSELNSDSGLFRHTLKYQNLNNVQEEGIPLYGDLLAEDDPFECDYSTFYYMAVDQKATEENGGMPVLIIEYAYEHGWIYTDNEKDPYMLYGIFSFNTATNQLTMLVGEMEQICTFYIRDDLIYFTQYLPIEDSDNEYGTFPFTVTTKGEDLTKYSYPDNLGMHLLGMHNDKLYYVQFSTGQLYKCDPNFENYELVLTDLITSAIGKTAMIRLNTTNPFICNGYLYYTANRTSTEIDVVEIHYHDIMRKPLGDLSASEEVVLDNIYYPLLDMEILFFEKHLYYCRLDETKIIHNETNATSILHDLSLATGEDTIVYDYSKENKKTFLNYITTNYYIVQNNDSDNIRYDIVNRKTGKETILAKS